MVTTLQVLRAVLQAQAAQRVVLQAAQQQAQAAQQQAQAAQQQAQAKQLTNCV